MDQEKSFFKTMMGIALPVTLQSLLQSSFSVIDQVMTGQLGSTSIAGIGLAGKFSSLFTVLVSAVAAAAGIMIAQYMGKKDSREVSRSFFMNLFAALFIAAVFTAGCLMFHDEIMGVYTKDAETKIVSAQYLRMIALSYFPIAANAMLAALLRCMDGAMIPLYAGIFSAAVNTGLNYLLIFGKFGFPKLGVSGAALASVISQYAGFFIALILFRGFYRKRNFPLEFVFGFSKEGRVRYMGILLPILICEFMWSLGENVYGAIYGRIGTADCAAMTLTSPVQVLFIGAMSGLAQASGILIGKTLGSEEYEKAYSQAKKLMLYGFIGAVVLSAALICVRESYVGIYRVDNVVKNTAGNILLVFALIAPVKVMNMILGGGIIRSGGHTKYVMLIDIIGTWGFGVPLGLLGAFLWKLPIVYVYFLLSLEECVRLGISFFIFLRRYWMGSLAGNDR